jgi:tetratricopeptide (TPR) repeat protein
MEREAYIHQVHELLKSRKAAEALALSDRYVDEHPEDAEGWRYRAHAFESAKDFAQAITAMSEAIRLSPREPGYRWLRGVLHLLAGLDDAAEQDMTMTLRSGAEAGSAYYDEMARLLRAEAYRRLGRAELARADCEHVREEACFWLNKLISRRTILDGLP